MKNTVTWRCSCRWPNRCVLSARRNCPSVKLMSDSRSWVGRLFHTWGPAAANERSPKRVLVRCTRHVSMSDELSRRCPVIDTWWQSSARYAGKRSCSAMYISTAILNWTRLWRRWTGSQCSCCRPGVMCSHLLVLVMGRAAAFWRACRRQYRLSLIPYSNELQ